jgi:hypothetical protein
MEKREVHTEWSTNEKCALEVAFGAASIGKKAACFMKQVGLNVAFASLMKAFERPIDGGLVIVSCDDPGPQSSQTDLLLCCMASPYSTRHRQEKRQTWHSMPSIIPLSIRDRS